MTKRHKIVSLYGWYANDNLGDDLLLESSLRLLANTDCRVVLYGDVAKINRILSELSNHIKNSVISIKARSASAVLRDAFRNDVFMIGGGGIFPTKNYLKGFFYLAVSLIYRIRAKSVVFAGVSIEEFNFKNPIMARVVCWLIRISSLFLTRDNMYLLSDLDENVKQQIVSIPDLVFSLPKAENGCNKRNQVVVCCANIFTGSPKAIKHDFVISLSKVISWLLADGYSISLLSFSKSDESLNREIIDCVNPGSAELAKLYSFSETRRRNLALFENASFAICMRFHSLVLSQISLCPYISISYSNKNSGLLDELNLNRWQVWFGTGAEEYLNQSIKLDSTKLIGLINQLNSERDSYRKHMIESNYQINQNMKNSIKMICKTIMEDK